MAFVAGSLPGFDAAKCVKMAIIHDIAEAVVGDITPHDGVTKADKHAREAAAVERMEVMLGPAAWATAGA
jgi:putative hydrolase of HD superfamily